MDSIHIQNALEEDFASIESNITTFNTCQSSAFAAILKLLQNQAQQHQKMQQRVTELEKLREADQKAISSLEVELKVSPRCVCCT